MKTISVSALSEVVRTNLQEIGVNESMMMGTSDDLMLDKIIANVAGLCADEIHLSAPSYMLDGLDVRASNSNVKRDKDVLILYPLDIVRLVSFKATDSDYVVSTMVPEDSPVGRMQKNEFVKGRYDSPVIVMSQGRSGEDTELKYYSLKDKQGDKTYDMVEIFKVIYRQQGSGTLMVADMVVPQFYALVTSRVLSIMGESEKANEYAARAAFNI